ncbi:MAG: hypothetical protein QOG64_2925, partial [Acidimicrobiaceae bacterium]|nr:hypothetical protein [Acidimicrobiaceae bacterium]
RFLIGLTRRLEASTRAEDVLARVGGDEFALLLHGVSDAQAIRIAEGVRQTVSTFRFSEDKQVFTVGVSIGVAMIDGSLDVHQLLTNADWACYAAKATGRNRVELFDPVTTNARRRPSGLPAQLEDSLRTDRFRLLYQPVMSATGDDVDCHEVLLRMVDDDGRLVQPGAFLDTAERFGLSGRIDRWVVRHALAKIEESAAAGVDLALAVNLSSAAVADASVSDAICADVRAAGPGGRLLMFEVAESAVVAGIADAQRLAASLRALGCRLAVDSFGAGLSSFAYLRHLSPDLLKIDESFVWGIEGDAVGQALVRSMSELAHGLGIRTVAKGVEQSSVRTTLAGLGVDLVQGFNIGVPGEQPVGR